MSQSDRCVIIVKAQPHRSSAYFETVCTAGIGADGKWRRQYPVPFRILNNPQKYKRWDWIDYVFSKPTKDQRNESQKVIPESIKVSGHLSIKERKFLTRLIRENFEDADARNESLTLLRPSVIDLTWKKKSQNELEDERRKHRALADQMSFFDTTARPIEPCPFQFSLRWREENGQFHRHENDDWESAAAFMKFQRLYGEDKALETLKSKYENEYMPRGLVLAFSTHERRNVTNNTSNQWLLVGLIRLDNEDHTDLFD